MRASQPVPDKNQVHPLHSEAMEGGQPRRNLNHRKLAGNTGSEREESRVRYKKNIRYLDHPTARDSSMNPRS